MKRILFSIIGLSAAVLPLAYCEDLTGVVRSPIGEGIPNAILIVRSAPEGNEIARSRTDPSGSYLFSLPSGNFSMTIESLGFQVTRFRDIALNAHPRALPPVMLELGNQCGSDNWGFRRR